MGIFKSTKTRNIFIYSICAIGIAASIATICVVLWPKGESSNTETTKTSSSQSTPQKKSVLVDQTCLSNAKALGPTDAEMNNYDLVIQSANKTIQMYDAELKCYDGTDMDIYSNTVAEIKSNKAELEQLLSNYYGASSQTYTYTEPQNTTTPTYNIPNYSQTPTTTTSCSEYHSKYYSQYTQKVGQANSDYNTAVQNASIECAGNGGGFSGCTSAAERRLKAQLDSKIQSYKSEYKQNMSSSGCDPSEYVDF